jgi:hypothetical protein
MKMSESLKTVKDKVGEILKDQPETRDSDKLLWLAYMNEFHNMREVVGEKAYLFLENLILSESTPTMESIRRVRQKYQESGLYVGKHRDDRIKEAESVEDWVLTTPF